MNKENFAHWLKGFLDGRESLNEEQIKKIRDELEQAINTVDIDLKKFEAPYDMGQIDFGQPSYPTYITSDPNTILTC